MKTLYKNCSPERVLALLAQSPGLTSKEVAEALGLGRQHAIDVLTRLRKDGRVTRTGSRRGFDYAITKTGENANAVEAIAGNVERDLPEAEAVSPVRSED